MSYSETAHLVKAQWGYLAQANKAAGVTNTGYYFPVTQRPEDSLVSVEHAHNSLHWSAAANVSQHYRGRDVHH